jgi:SsrA-binding protein
MQTRALPTRGAPGARTHLTTKRRVREARGLSLRRRAAYNPASMARKRQGEAPDGIKIVVVNRRARFEYELIERHECGLVLTGTEVKSLRGGHASLVEGYAEIEDGQAFLVDVTIQPYECGNRQNHVPTRRRKLLLHKKEIQRLHGKVREKGLTLVPTQLYFKHGLAKAEIALARGKKVADKRETIKRREQDREMRRAVKERR